MHPPLRPFQSRSLQALSRPESTHLLLVAPTGSGKSLIFQEYARRSGKRTLLLSPLLALAHQHAERFRSHGVSAAVLGEGREEKSQAWIASPEKLFSPDARKWRRALQERKIEFLVVDECHALREWGERFRPAFREIPEWFRKESLSKSAWLTATLPKEDREWMRTFLPSSSCVEEGGFEMPAHLTLRVERSHAGARPARLFSWIREQGQKGILFTQTRSGSERVRKLLQAARMKVRAYHAGLSREERRAIENEMRASDPPLLVATTAFGMGMDLDSLDWVLLLQPPLSVLQLAQQIGRAGRGSRKGNALLLWDETDFREPWSDPKALGEVRSFLHSPGCRTRALELWFGEIQSEESPPCGRCDRCVTLNM